MPTDLPRSEPSRVTPGDERRSAWLKWLFLPLRWLYKLYFAVVFFGSLVVLYVPFRILLFRPRRYQRAFRLKRAWAFFLQWALFLPLRIERRGKLPGAPYINCCNHSSYLDIIQMYNVVTDRISPSATSIRTDDRTPSGNNA